MFAETHDESALDVDALLRLARDRSASARTRLVEIIGDLFFEESRVLSERERATMNDILRRLIHDVEVSVRKHLAIRLSDEPDAPADLIIALANDDAEIAHPILVRSQVLRDPELIEIVHNRTLEHQLAIAMRTSVSQAVSDALVATENPSVVERLLRNPGAEFAQRTMAHLVEQSRRIDAFQNPLVRRKDLPDALARRMYWWVSAALRTEILESHDFDPDALDDVIETAVSAATRSDSADGPGGAAGAQLVAHLIDVYGMTGDLLIDLLRSGEVKLFEQAIEHATALRRDLVQRLIYEPGGEGLAIMCRALGIASGDFASLHALCRKAHPQAGESYPVARHAPEKFFEQIEPGAARRVLDRWRRNPDYLDLLRQVEALAASGS